MKIAHCMMENPPRVTPLATIEQAASEMRRNDLRALPICHGDQLLGIVTAWDIICRGIAEGKDSWFSSVGEIMTSDVESCKPSDDVEAVQARMAKRDFYSLPVIGSDGALAGLVTRQLLAEALAQRIASATITEFRRVS